ncbi:M15 family metallopeptidase [Inediibacterium massiliense]|uniref:M15 family metallopeptidase n=1 Tax=Inediibacterium massiliense TaxID=1658111 RepID=UPI0006B53AE9|nr:M15 family metallopeptidase [Inediibacterium massiliense]
MKNKKWITLFHKSILLIGSTAILSSFTYSEDIQIKGKLEEQIKIMNEYNKENSIDEQASIEDINQFTYEPLPEEIKQKIQGVSWKKNPYISLDDLAYARVCYVGFDNQDHQGELIVHKKVAKEVVEIFEELYKSKFPIEKIKLIDEYGASDELSMADNNTSAFCFREVTGNNKNLSKHSYGIAIDINPIQNPYIKGKKVAPLQGKQYMNRLHIQKGMIVKDDICYKAFKNRGWTWGGEWKSLKDYQHFEKNISLK